MILLPAGLSRPWFARVGKRLPVLIILALVVLTRLIWVGRATLLPDEAYYWDWSRRLALGYFDHPPLVAVVIRTATTFLGTSEFAVRAGMAVLGAGTVALAYKAGVILGGPLAGWLCLLGAATCPLFVLLSEFAAPDGPLIFLWAATIYALLLALTTGRARYWYLAGILLGFALLAKYVAILLIPSVLLALLFSRSRWLRRHEPYAACGLALLVFSPNLWWNLRHGWTSISFQLAHGACQSASVTSSRLHDAGVYLVTQISIVGPLLAIFLVAGVAASIAGYKGIPRESGVLLACSTLVTSILFFLVNGLAHWAAPAYFSAILCSGVGLARLLRRVTSWRRAILLVCCLLAILSTAGESAYLVSAVAAGAPVPGPLGQMVEPTLIVPALRWRDVGATISTVLHEPEIVGHGSVALLADTYGTAAEVAFYTAGRPHVYSGSNQYSVWGVSGPPSDALLFVGNAGILRRASPASLDGVHRAAAVTVRSAGQVVRQMEISVVPARSLADRPSLQSFLATVWHTAATQCESE